MQNSINSFFILIAVLFFYNTQAQNNKIATVTYKIGIYENEKKENENDDKLVRELYQALDEINYILTYDKNQSLFKLQKQLIIKNEFAYKLASLQGGDDNTTRYKSLKEKIKFVQTQALGEKFIIDYPFEEYSWNITGESKEIEGFTCYKATTTTEEYDYSRDITIIQNPIAWFTPEISAPFGPIGLDGLPGLILEASMNGKTFFLATKIDFNNENKKLKLSKPTKGRHITPDEYNKLIATLSPIGN